jgi:adenylate cyclase
MRARDVQPMSSKITAQTFLFADLAGYTALTEAHGDELAADTAAEFCAAARELVRGAGGEEVKALGDGLMLRMPDAARAVRFGAALVTDTVGHRSLGVRVGMHTGAAVQRGADWFGSTVNIAARVAALAGAGEVLLTHATRDAAEAGLRGVVLDARGIERLRHVGEPIELWAVRLEDPRLLVDPVCHMALDPARAEASRQHDGVEHRFCSQECAEAFERDPGRYVR